MPIIIFDGVSKEEVNFEQNDASQQKYQNLPQLLPWSCFVYLAGVHHLSPGEESTAPGIILVPCQTRTAG
jgi:hypothetical protein